MSLGVIETAGVLQANRSGPNKVHVHGPAATKNTNRIVNGVRDVPISFAANAPCEVMRLLVVERSLRPACDVKCWPAIFLVLLVLYFSAGFDRS